MEMHKQIKTQLPHAVFACVCNSALRFQSYYIENVECKDTNVFTLKTQHIAAHNS